MQIFQDPVIQIIVILLFVILTSYMLLTIMSRKKEKSKTDPYVEALEAVTEGEVDKAVEKFKEAIQQNSNNIGAYLRLGDQLRIQGLVSSALKIHKSLTLRESHSKQQLLAIYKSLVLDYEALEDYDHAISAVNMVIELDKSKNSWAVQKLVYFQERAGKWQEVIDTTKKYSKILNRAFKSRLAKNLVSYGVQFEKNGESRSGRIKYREAIKTDPTYSPAYYQLGKSYIDNNRLDDALNIWKDFCFKVPEKAHEVFPLIEKVCFEKGEFSDIEDLYNELLNLETKNVNTVIALVEIYLKKGNFNKAMDVLTKSEENFQDSPEFAAKKVEVLHHKGEHEKASSEALKFFNRLYPSGTRSKEENTTVSSENFDIV
jgi:lipopolysaccharide biosynthesis regulator YciM